MPPGRQATRRRRMLSWLLSLRRCAGGAGPADRRLLAVAARFPLRCCLLQFEASCRPAAAGPEASLSPAPISPWPNSMLYVPLSMVQVVADAGCVLDELSAGAVQALALPGMPDDRQLKAWLNEATMMYQVMPPPLLPPPLLPPPLLSPVRRRRRCCRCRRCCHPPSPRHCQHHAHAPTRPSTHSPLIPPTPTHPTPAPAPPPNPRPAPARPPRARQCAQPFLG